MTDYAEIVKRLRKPMVGIIDSVPSQRADAATAIETLLAQRAVLVEEVEAGRAWRDSNAPGGSDRSIALNLAWREARAATDVAFPEGLTK